MYLESVLLDVPESPDVTKEMDPVGHAVGVKMMVSFKSHSSVGTTTHLYYSGLSKIIVFNFRI